MPPKGAQPPRVGIVISRSNDALSVAAFQVGLVVSAKRNRLNLTQEDLASAVGLKNHAAISSIELGKPAGGMTPAKFDSLFRKLELPVDGRQASFIRWWQDHGA